MISQTEHRLIALLKGCGLDRESTVATVALCETDKNMQTMIDWILEYHETRGQVTDEVVGKMLLYLTGERKSSAPNSTPTGADTE